MITLKNWTQLILLVVTATACATAPLNEAPVEQKSPVPAEAPPDAKESMVEIGPGTFYFGVTQRQFQLYLSQTRMNFPGMVEQMKEQLTVPPRTQFKDRFYMSRFEVTNRAFNNFLRSTSYNPSVRRDFLRHWEGSRHPGWAADFPVVWVSGSDAAAYCRWVGGELPSETQWEKAARGGAGARAFPWGETQPSESMVNCASGQAEPVGDRAEDVSPFQVYDLGGNVSEFTRSTASNGPQEFIIRGGSFKQSTRYALVGIRLRSAARDQRFEDVGFRCVAY